MPYDCQVARTPLMELLAFKKGGLYNIRVHALDGSCEWVSSTGASLQSSFFAWLTNYQNSALPEEKFKGVHLDVEPYLNSLYSTNMNAVLQNYQACFVNSLSKCNALGLTLGVDIPFWFDEVSYTTPYASGNLAQWVIKNVKNVTVMAYRDTTLGSNGIIRTNFNRNEPWKAIWFCHNNCSRNGAVCRGPIPIFL